MENHIWGDFCAEDLAQNSMGAVLDLDSIECTAGYKIEIFIGKLLKRNTNRKAKYNPSFYRICIGFFCASIRMPHGRSPPRLKVYQKTNE